MTKNSDIPYKDKTLDYFMKTNKLFIFLAGILLLIPALQLASACQDNRYNDLSTNDDVIFIIRNVEASSYNSQYWENEDRFPVNDYRNGYSYRSTLDYREDLNDRIYRNTYIEDRFDSDYHNYVESRIARRPAYDFQEEPQYYYTYDNYMRSYSEHECYTHAPSDKLVYAKCP